MRFSIYIILIISILFLSSNINPDIYIEKITESSTKSNLIKIWKKGTLYKAESIEKTIVYNSLNDSIRYESHLLKLYWEGSAKEFINAKNLVYPPKNKEDKKRKKNRFSPKKTSIKITFANDSLNISDIYCKKYQVVKNNKIIETFFYTNQINLFKPLEYNIISLLTMQDISNAGVYFNSENYLKYRKNGLIMKREIAKDSIQNYETEEVINLSHDEIIPDVFSLSNDYHLQLIEEILRAEKKELNLIHK